MYFSPQSTVNYLLWAREDTHLPIDPKQNPEVKSLKEPVFEVPGLQPPGDSRQMVFSSNKEAQNAMMSFFNTWSKVS